MNLELRTATKSDCQFVFDLSNDEAVRTSSLNQEKITWSTHELWFKNKLDSSDDAFYIAEIKDKAMGQVRFVIRDDVAEISLSLSCEFRGCGLGSSLIKLSCDRVFADFPVQKIHAVVKNENESSIRSFEKSNFKKTFCDQEIGISRLELTKR